MTQVYLCVNMVDALCSATAKSNICRQAVTQVQLKISEQNT